MPRNDQAREALTSILELANAALGSRDREHEDAGAGADPEGGCTVRALPTRLQQDAAALARSLNPANAPLFGAAAGMFGDTPPDPAAITMLTAKYFGPKPRRLTVSFMDTPSAALRNRILSHLNAWSKSCGISFVHTQGTGQVRISRGTGGYWSYLGTDILLIPTNRPTMNLEGFTMNHPESEFCRVVRHEAGHTLGCPHEHMRKELVNRIDRNKAYSYFWQTQGWSKAMVDQQVLTPLDAASIIGTPADQTSIMCYQLPGTITKDGKPITGGIDINATDYAFMGKLYPRPGASTQIGVDAEYSQPDEAQAVHATHGHVDDWDPSEDPHWKDAAMSV